MKVSRFNLSPDGKTVTLTVPGLKPVMQMRIAYDLKTAAGANLPGVVWNTIHHTD